MEDKIMRPFGIDKSIELPESITGSFVEAFAKNHWGVFEYNFGTACITYERLIAVEQSEATATQIAEGLFSSVEYENSDDPESGVYRGVNYYAAEIALDGIKFVAQLRYKKAITL